MLDRRIRAQNDVGENPSVQSLDAVMPDELSPCFEKTSFRDPSNDARVGYLRISSNIADHQQHHECSADGRCASKSSRIQSLCTIFEDTIIEDTKSRCTIFQDTILRYNLRGYNVYRNLRGYIRIWREDTSGFGERPQSQTPALMQLLASCGALRELQHITEGGTTMSAYKELSQRNHTRCGLAPQRV